MSGTTPPATASTPSTPASPAPDESVLTETTVMSPQQLRLMCIDRVLQYNGLMQGVRGDTGMDRVVNAATILETYVVGSAPADATTPAAPAASS